MTLTADRKPDHSSREGGATSYPSQSPRRRVQRLAAGAATAIALGLGVAACGDSSDAAVPAVTDPPAPTTASSAPVARPTELVDEAVAIAGGKMHLRCVGEGATTVVLLAGWGHSGDSWGSIEPTIAEGARVCSYSRFGTGTSDPPAAEQTFFTQAADLHSLLEAAGEPGPYLLLGHSFGGPQAVAFASEHPDEVVGMLLLDASPVTWPAAVCAIPDDGSDAAGQAQTLCATMHDPALDPVRLDVIRAFDEVADVTSLGDLPVTVVSAARRTWPGLAATEIDRLTGVWQDGVARWAALSSNSSTRFVEDTGHYIQLEQPEIVIDEVLALLPASS